MSDAITTIDTIINNAITVGQKTTAEAIQYAERAANWNAFLYRDSAPTFNYSKVSPPQLLPADMYNTAAIQAAFDYSFSKFDDRFKSDIDYVLSTFFPDLTDCLVKTADSWICDVIENGGTGLPPAVEEALYSRGKERLTEDAYRAETEAMTLFASRGFSLPPGVLFAKAQEVQQLALDKAGDLSRDVLVENTKIKVETVKFAVDQSTKIRLGMFDALSRFLDASSKVPLSAVDYSKSFIDARRGVAEAIVSYYNARIREDELTLKADTSKAEIKQAQFASWAGANASLFGHQATAIVGAANAVGQLAQAAMSSQNTVTNLGHTVSESI